MKDKKINPKEVRKKLIKIYTDFINSSLVRKNFDEDEIERLHYDIEGYYLIGQGNKNIANAVWGLERIGNWYKKKYFGNWYRRMLINLGIEKGMRIKKMTKEEAKEILKSLSK